MYSKFLIYVSFACFSFGLVLSCLRISSHVVIVECQFIIKGETNGKLCLPTVGSGAGGFSCGLMGLQPNHFIWRFLPPLMSLTTDIFSQTHQFPREESLEIPPRIEQLGCQPFGRRGMCWGFSVLHVNFTQAFSSWLLFSATAVVFDIRFSLSGSVSTKNNSSQT